MERIDCPVPEPLPDKQISVRVGGLLIFPRPILHPVLAMKGMAGAGQGWDRGGGGGRGGSGGDTDAG